MRFDTAMSLGTHCYTAWLLRRAGLASASYPFDWLFSDLRMNSHCIRDRFETLLDPHLFVEHEGKVGNSVYSPLYHRYVIFNHHDPREKKTLADFRRRAERCLDAIAGGGVYFLAVTDEKRTPLKCVDQALKDLERACPNFYLDIIWMQPIGSDDRLSGEIVQGESAPSFSVNQFYPRSHMRAGLAFENDEDNKVLERFAVSRFNERHETVASHRV